ncbi:hypothetical protein DAPPUDRAFT_97349 [Daphnia pulex]|uniref:F-box domain-containing protein n=1 Tax=Daphnia pulex TaxID=6669 RepID=E9FZQ2_DAPPU|nr:hypothetical protein DAPPUDRAFT_97349 [Daphnia pulex]|eukprot:EFX87228.1 hypothetical protein DAPPUDRAFT_97349 [Daphnia pulex]
MEDGENALDSDLVNPINQLPTVLLEELVQISREKKIRYEFSGAKQLTLLFLEQQMTNHLRTLDFTRVKRGTDVSDILHLATIKSPNLETLRLDHFTYQYLANFSFIPKFTKLRILDISFYETDDDCFLLIGKHCPDLRELHANNSLVTDDGIQNLCVIGNCKFIRKLNLENCNKITIKGIQLALDNLPQLRALCNESLLEGLAEIAQSATDQKLDLPQYSMSTLNVLYKTVYKSGSLRQSVLLFPNVTEVYLSIRSEEFKNADLLSLLLLEKLYTIEIAHDVYEPIQGAEIRIHGGLTFDGVVPLLKKFGYILKRINIGGFLVVDIPTIFKFCPNLESLTLYNSKTTQSTETEVEWPILRNLKTLIVRYSTISSENLVALLSSSSLVYVSMVSCDALNDNVLQRAANLHSFCNLEHLHISWCHSVTKNGIEIFLQESNPLREIVLHCSEDSGSRITREDIANWNETAIWIKKNWRFNFILQSSCRNIFLGGYKWERRRGEF